MKEPAFKSYFEARDFLDITSMNMPVEFNMAQMAIFRFLLSHTMFTQDDDYGRVDDRWTRQETIADAVRCSREYVNRALKILENKVGAIKRKKWRDGAPGSVPDEIRITWRAMYKIAEGEPGSHSIGSD